MTDLDQDQEHTELCTLQTNLNYQEFLDSKLITDCKIIVDDKEYDAHRVILANASIFFYNMFTSDMDEAKTCRVSFKDENNVFQYILNWIYNGKISFPGDKIFPIIELSNFLGVDTLNTKLRDYLLEKTTQATIPQFLCESTEKYPAVSIILTKKLSTILKDISRDEIEKFIENISKDITCEMWGDTLENYDGSNDEKLRLTEYFLGDLSQVKSSEEISYYRGSSGLPAIMKKGFKDQDSKVKKFFTYYDSQLPK